MQLVDTLGWIIAAFLFIMLTLRGLTIASARSAAWCDGFRDGMGIGYKTGYAKGKLAGTKQAHGLPFADEPEISDEYLAELMGSGGAK